MSSTQRSIFLLSASVSALSVAVPSDAYETPKGANTGGVQVAISLGTGGNYAGGTVGAVLEATTDANDAGTAPSSSASWQTVPGGTVPAAGAATAAYLGDGNLTVDISPFRWIRLRPTVTGSPVNIVLRASGKFDYTTG